MCGGSQRAACAAEALPVLEEEAKERRQATLKKGPVCPDVAILPQREAGKARDVAGKLFNTSARYVQDAKALKEKAPDKFEEVKTGKKSLPQAVREVRLEALQWPYFASGWPVSDR